MGNKLTKRVFSSNYSSKREKDLEFLLKSVVASVIIALLIFLALITYAPDDVAFSPNNYGWNGMQSLNSNYSIHYVTSAPSLNVQNKTVLLIISPTINFTDAYASSVTRFVQRGGILVIADKSGFANFLLHALGLGVSIESSLAILDGTYNWRSQEFPLAQPQQPSLGNSTPSIGLFSKVQELALSAPSPLLLASNSSAAMVTAYSSPQSYSVNRADLGPLSTFLNGNSPPTPISNGPFAIATLLNLGSGAVLVISDPQIFSNSQWEILGNKVLLQNLLTNATILADTSHWEVSSAAVVKAQLTSLFTKIALFPNYYLLALALGLILVALFEPFSKRGTIVEKRALALDDLEESATYSKETLERVRRDRAKYGSH